LLIEPIKEYEDMKVEELSSYLNIQIHGNIEKTI